MVGHWHGRYFETNDDKLSLPSLLFSSSPSNSRSISVSPIEDGWRQIDVFYGKAAISNHTWFSQAAQDELVIGLLRGKRDGYFIDLAANDAMLLSNTYAMEQYYGWYVVVWRFVRVF